MTTVNSFEKLWRHCMNGDIVPNKTRIKFEGQEMLVIDVKNLYSSEFCSFDKHGNEKIKCKDFLIDLEKSPDSKFLDWFCVSHYDLAFNSIYLESFTLEILF